MKILILPLAACFLLPSLSQAESIACGFTHASTAPDQATKTFRILADRNESAEKWALVIEVQRFRAGKPVSGRRLAPITILGQKSGPRGNRAWSLKKGGELLFRATHVKNSTYHGEVVYRPPGAADFAEVVEDCYLDPKEVGFIIKN